MNFSYNWGFGVLVTATCSARQINSASCTLCWGNGGAKFSTKTCGRARQFFRSNFYNSRPNFDQFPQFSIKFRPNVDSANFASLSHKFLPIFDIFKTNYSQISIKFQKNRTKNLQIFEHLRPFPTNSHKFRPFATKSPPRSPISFKTTFRRNRFDI